jgi:hypothetical protein
MSTRPSPLTRRGTLRGFAPLALGLLVTASIAYGTGGCSSDEGGCTKDNDCATGRICGEDGRCVDLGSTSSSAVTGSTGTGGTGGAVGSSATATGSGGNATDGDDDGYAVSQGDCDDANAKVHPFAGDTFGDGIDADCDGLDFDAVKVATGAYYVLVPEWVDADKAAARCAELGYERLGEIFNGDEQAAQAGLPSPGYLSKYKGEFGNGKRLWIGLRRVGSTFQWASGATATYAAWFPTGEPSGDGDCVEGDAVSSEYPTGGWNDIPCSQPMPFVCEKRLSNQSPEDGDCTSLRYAAGTVPKLESPLTYPATWTLEGWARVPSFPSPGNWGALVGVDAVEACPGMSKHWYVDVQSDGTISGWALGNGAASTTKLVAGKWFHFALQYEGGGTGKLYVDGKLTRSATSVDGTWPLSCKMKLGNTQGSVSHFLGADVASLRYSKGIRYSSTFVTEPVLTTDASTLWRIDFSEGSGNAAKDPPNAATWDVTGSTWVSEGPACTP